MITKEEFEFLEQYEVNFRTAVFSDYSRNVQRSVLEKMVAIYDREKNTSTHMSYSCGGCQLSFLKRMGNLFFQEKEKQNRTSDGVEPILSTNELQDKATNKNINKKKNGKRKTDKRE